ncbi:Fis family transcriptional regulator [Pandoraea captiosa]|uniref:Fis family transcriptional regulator n=1 Tax=Pandoraea captiosa TaxID=2508302 RepID=A0A5E4ZKQ9_9BURK|nr:sigma-54 dependent transcriptional regulator [Pandoraea captiosa]VVE61939.1 Fis family transcriptional regulator [Pandoraea captiosa]
MAVHEDAYARLAGDSRSVTELRAKIERLANVPANVLIVGESGSGKEVVARYLHDAGPRHPLPFVAVNCAAIPHELAESQLFGHERGSFTGAVSQRLGVFEAASDGTLFLDEIQDMPLPLQVKLLRALETRTVVRVGGSEPVGFTARVVAATHAHPGRAVREGRLREDLLFRLAAFTLYVPPLRRRDNDVIALAQTHLDRLNTASGTAKRFSAQSLAVLRRHTWPGNVRELHNTIERAFIMTDGDLDLQPLPVPKQREELRDGALNIPIGATLAQAQQAFIAATLQHFDGDKPRTAKALGISLKTLYNRLALMTQDTAQSEGMAVAATG